MRHGLVGREKEAWESLGGERKAELAGFAELDKAHLSCLLA